jgi:hypothetical protein
VPPGEQVDRIGADDVNAVASYLSDLVRRFHLPQKLLIVHEFGIDTIIDPDRLHGVDGVALVLDTDGSAAIPDKVTRYRAIAKSTRRQFHGIHLFLRQDQELMEPNDVLRLWPHPDLIVYQ